MKRYVRNKWFRVLSVYITVLAILLLSIGAPTSGLASKANASDGGVMGLISNGAAQVQDWMNAPNPQVGRDRLPSQSDGHIYDANGNIMPHGHDAYGASIYNQGAGGNAANHAGSGGHHGIGAVPDDTESYTAPSAYMPTSKDGGVQNLLNWRAGALVQPALTLSSPDPSEEVGNPEVPKDDVRNMSLLANIPRSGTNSDLAFWGNLAIAGNYGGFRVINIANPAQPQVLSTVACQGAQNDVSVWGNLVFLSVDRPQTLPTCSQDAPNPNDPSTFEGVRIFNISNPAAPLFVSAIPTDCGSHTHTIVPDLANNRVLLYVSSYFVSNGPHCGPGRGADPRHKKISIISVPLDAPETASVISTPAIEADPFILGSGETIGCHDISVFMDLNIAAGACMSEGQLWDITDPANPQTLKPITRIRNDAFDFWHSATFTWDGRLVLFSDETFTNGCTSPSDLDGRIWIYANYGSHELLGSYVQPRTGTSYCSAHLYNILPTTDGFLFASSWYQGGVNIVDFNHPNAPQEDAYYRVNSVASNTWSAYWYNGYIYAGDISRGFDVYSFTTSNYHEYRQFPYLNPQTQERVVYPPPNRPIEEIGQDDYQ